MPARTYISTQRKGDSMTKLNDLSPMPWGKYKGTLMQDVPASYLFWLWAEAEDPHCERVQTSNIADYINRNLATLQTEHPDGIW